MYILSIIPIARGIPFNTLSYYYTEALSVGMVVQIPLGKQVISGLLYECTSLLEAKTSIKQATFSLKRIKGVIGGSPFTTALVEGLQEASGKTLTPIGSLAHTLISELFFDVLQQSSTPFLSIRQETPPPVVVYGPRVDRMDAYKRIIRSAFAQKKSVVLVAPSIRSIEYWYTVLQKGIASHSILLHSKRTKRDQKASCTAIKNSDRPLLICTTPYSAAIPRCDISTILLEDESSSLYKVHDRYGADMRVVLESFAKASHIQMVYGDTLPRFETLEKTGSSRLPRSFTPEKLAVVTTESYRTTIPTETIELVRYCQKNKKSIFVYTNRKGIAPVSRCADCGTSVDCPTCGLPIVLRYRVIEGERERLFTCSHCGDTLLPTHVCVYCASWNITPVSVGTESIRESLCEIVGAEHVLTVDDDLTPDTKEIENLIHETQKHKWFVLVGTQKLLPYIKNIDFIVIPFFDRMLSLPSPFIVEEVVRLIMECNEKVKDTVVLCTKKPDFPITSLLATKKIHEVVQSDIDIRRVLSYPPFGTLLKLSVTVPSAHRDAVVEKVTRFFDSSDITLLPIRRISPDSMKVLCTWIIQVNNDYTTDYGEDMQIFLQDLRFPHSIDINPSRLT